MLNIFLLIAPIFVLIILGYGLRRGGIPSIDFWNMNDKLVYWVLFPALLFYKMSTIEVSTELVNSYAVIIIGAFLITVVIALLFAYLIKLKGPAATSLLQGSARHNTFIALAIAETLFGTSGLEMAALITAILIPMTNITIVTLMAFMLHREEKKGMIPTIFKELIRNPLLLAVGLGFACNSLQIGQIPVIHDIARLLGDAALPVMLLCVGANIRVRAMAAVALPILFSMIGKMLVFPLAIIGLALGFDLSGQAIMVAVIFGVVPTASSGFTLARELGGDAPLMAAIITLQTAISFVTLPIAITIAQHYLA